MKRHDLVAELDVQATDAQIGTAHQPREIMDGLSG